MWAHCCCWQKKKKGRDRKSEIKKENHSQFSYLTDNKHFLLQCLLSIQEQFARAAGVPRNEALQKRRRVSNDRIPLVCYWDERLPDLGGGGGGGIPVQQYFPVLQSDASLEECFTAPPLLSFRRPRNLRDTLVYGTQNNRMLPLEPTSASTALCWRDRAKNARKNEWPSSAGRHKKIP